MECCSTSARRLESTAPDLHEKANGARVIFGRVIQNLEQRPSRRVDDVVNISWDEEQDDQENGASKGADAHTGNHDFGALDRSVGDFWKVISIGRSARSESIHLRSCGRRHPRVVSCRQYI